MLGRADKEIGKVLERDRTLFRAGTFARTAFLERLSWRTAPTMAVRAVILNEDSHLLAISLVLDSFSNDTSLIWSPVYTPRLPAMLRTPNTSGSEVGSHDQTSPNSPAA